MPDLDSHFPLPPGPFAFEACALGLNAVDRLLTVGRYPERGGKVFVDRVDLRPGGQAATAMVACRAFGLKQVRYAGKVGDDEFGQLQLVSLDEAGVERSLVRVEPRTASQWADIIIDGESGERTIFWQRSARLNFQVGELEDEALLTAPVLLLDGYDQDNALRLAIKARSRGIRTVSDLDRVFPDTEKLVAHLDLCISSREFPTALTGEADLERALQAMARLGPGVMGATLGPEGVGVLLAGRLTVIPAYSIRAVDTTGAGDVFHAGLVYGLTQSWPLGKILRFANAAAALKCLAPGARGNLVKAEEVEKWLGGRL